jgi:hypothetical protein
VLTAAEQLKEQVLTHIDRPQSLLAGEVSMWLVYCPARGGFYNGFPFDPKFFPGFDPTRDSGDQPTIYRKRVRADAAAGMLRNHYGHVVFVVRAGVRVNAAELAACRN